MLTVNITCPAFPPAEALVKTISWRNYTQFKCQNWPWEILLLFKHAGWLEVPSWGSGVCCNPAISPVPAVLNHFLTAHHCHANNFPNTRNTPQLKLDEYIYFLLNPSPPPLPLSLTQPCRGPQPSFASCVKSFSPSPSSLPYTALQRATAFSVKKVLTLWKKKIQTAKQRLEDLSRWSWESARVL